MNTINCGSIHNNISLHSSSSEEVATLPVNEQENLIKFLTETLAKLLELLSSLTNQKNEASLSRVEISSRLVASSKVHMDEQIKKINEYYEALKKQKEEDASAGPFKVFAKVLGSIVGALLGALTGGAAGVAVFTLIFVLTSPDVTGQGKSPLSLLAEQVGGPPWAQALFKVSVILALTLTASGITTAAAKGAANTATNTVRGAGGSTFSFNTSTAFTAVQLFSALNPTVDIAVTGAQIAGADEEETKKRAQWAHMALAFVLSIMCLIKGTRSEGSASSSLLDSLGKTGKALGTKIIPAIAIFSSLAEIGVSSLQISQGVRSLDIAEKKADLQLLEAPIEELKILLQAMETLQESSDENTDQIFKDLSAIINDFAPLVEMWRAESETFIK